MKKVTNDNYFDVWKTLSRTDGISEIPVELSQSHETVKSIHEMGGWDSLDNDADLKEFKDLFFESLQDFIEKNAPDIFSDSKGNDSVDEPEPDEKSKRGRKKRVKEEIPEPEIEEEEEVEETEVTRDETPQAEKPVHKKEGKKRIQRPQASLVNSFPAEYKVIRKVAHLNGKAKSRSQLLRILKSLQKDILEHRIRKTSPYADEIVSIQKQLVTAVKSLKDEKPIPIHLAEAAMTRFNKIIGEEALRPSIQLIKRYVSLHGQSVDKEKAERLLTQIQQGITKGKIAKKDPYFKEVKKIEKSLKTFIDQGCGMLSIHTPELDGLNGILSGCGCNNLHGLDGIPTNANGAFRTDQLPDSSHLTLEFSGKWRDLFGQPAQGFSVMTYGLPKTGKSTLMLEFAGYLARNFGTPSRPRNRGSAAIRCPRPGGHFGHSG